MGPNRVDRRSFLGTLAALVAVPSVAIRAASDYRPGLQKFTPAPLPEFVPYTGPGLRGLVDDGTAATAIFDVPRADLLHYGGRMYYFTPSATWVVK